VGEIVRYKRDVWGEEVILGVSWDLLWVVAVAVLVLLAAHAIIMAALANKKIEKASSEGRRVLRHETIDRLFHWVMAASILTLIATVTYFCCGVSYYSFAFLARFQVYDSWPKRFRRTIRFNAEAR
jgi:formate dehydrogenase subunit gamma